MTMTHYMELLATNQPWNLLIFMALPVMLAETLTITELSLLLTRKTSGRVKKLNRWSGLFVGLCFVAILGYLVPTVAWPLTRDGGWRTILDAIAVISYLLGGIPMILVALQEMGIIDARLSPERRLARHATYVATFLILAHVAMIFGMLDPGLLAPAQPDHMSMHSM